MGLSPSEVAEGYETACEKAISILPGQLVLISLSVVPEGRGGVRISGLLWAVLVMFTCTKYTCTLYMCRLIYMYMRWSASVAQLVKHLHGMQVIAGCRGYESHLRQCLPSDYALPCLAFLCIYMYKI